MNVNPLRGATRFAGSAKGAWLSLTVWLVLAALLAVAAPSAKEVAVSGGEGSANGRNPAAEAQRLLDEKFPAAQGVPALLVFHRPDGRAVDAGERERIEAFGGWLAETKPEGILSALPADRLPDAERSKLYSADGATALLSLSLREGLESDETLDALTKVKEAWTARGAPGVTLDMTGPAAIAADTLQLFRNADVVLMLATVALILVLLVAIYRSALLAVIPLAVAGIAYSVTDRLIGLAGRAGWFSVDKQSLSIMMILLFAALTDYSLFVFSRYREELKADDSKHAAMGRAMGRVAEPILFSGGTVLVAMLALFFASFKPYHGFAPVFAVAVVVMLAAGLTLIPAVFAIAGRKSFRAEASRKTGKPASRQPIWERLGRLAADKPRRTAGALLLLLLLAALNVADVRYSFNLMKSFPADTSSRQGFEILETSYPPGSLAPVTLLVQHDKAIEPDDPAMLNGLHALVSKIKQSGGVESVTPDLTGLTALPADALSKDGRSVKLQLTLATNPYDKAALDLLDGWRDDEAALLKASGLNADEDRLLFAGQTAEQADVRGMNERDTALLFPLIACCIGAMLLWQTRSFKLTLAMLGTILLSFAAALGLSWAVFKGLLGYDAISYRIPMYTFVFMVALGVDYNIMLVSRIREEARSLPWKEAVARGVASTGGVISSAGVILAATFGVLMTQPMQELFLFGFAMAAGILIDTFVVRGLLLPAILAPMRFYAKRADR